MCLISRIFPETTFYFSSCLTTRPQICVRANEQNILIIHNCSVYLKCSDCKNMNTVTALKTPPLENCILIFVTENILARMDMVFNASECAAVCECSPGHQPHWVHPLILVVMASLLYIIILAFKAALSSKVRRQKTFEENSRFGQMFSIKAC